MVSQVEHLDKAEPFFEIFGAETPKADKNLLIIHVCHHST